MVDTQLLLSAFVSAAPTLAESGLALAKIDATQYPDLRKEFGVSDYPSLVVRVGLTLVCSFSVCLPVCFPVCFVLFVPGICFFVWYGAPARTYMCFFGHQFICGSRSKFTPVDSNEVGTAGYVQSVQCVGAMHCASI